MTFPKGIHDAAVRLYGTLDTPRALSALIMLRHGEWDQLVSLTIDPHHYLDCPSGADKFRRDAQATDFLRKSPDVPASFSKLNEAYRNFEVSEEQCYRTNRFLDMLDDPLNSDPLVFGAARKILFRASKIVDRILGPLPDSLDLGFGPGTSFELKGHAYTTLMDKLYVTPGITHACLNVFRHSYDPSHWGRARVCAGLPHHTIVRGNRFTTVPKTAKTDRGICIEPLGNLAVQLGIGRYMKRRLGLVGLHVDRNVLRDPISALGPSTYVEGQLVHRSLARKGSRDGTLATIDLSNASDTVCRELVRRILPPLWYRLLDSARSPLTLYRGRWRHIEKFSSMGNGFTFELETLIFAALLAAAGCGVVGKSVHVYGDDIIIPNAYADTAKRVLEFFGFTPNLKKSFHTSAFRESCGGDYFNGEPVRAVMVTQSIASPPQWMGLHNRLLETLPNSPGKRQLLNTIRQQVPKKMRLAGPRGLGHVTFWSDDPNRWTLKWDEGYCGFLVKTLKSIPFTLKLDRWSSEMQLTAALLGVSPEGVSPRGEPLGYMPVWARLLLL